MISLSELASIVGAELRGDGSRRVRGCAGLEEAESEEVSFLANPRYTTLLESTRAGAVIMDARNADRYPRLDALVAPDPYFAFREAVVALHGFRSQPAPGISDRASIHPSAQIGARCAVQDFVFIAEEATIGDGCVLYPHCYIGPRARIGSGTILYPNVTVYEGCVLGDRVILHAGCVVGNDGFGFAPHCGANHKIPQKGTAIIENDVEMGANCVVDRAALGVTRIGAGTKTANVVVIGHGAAIGRHNLYSALSGVAGSAKVGDYVMMGGQAGVSNHVRVGDHVRIAARSAVMEDLPEGARVMGNPARDMREATRNALSTDRVPDLAQRLQELESRLARLEGRHK